MADIDFTTLDVIESDVETKRNILPREEISEFVMLRAEASLKEDKRKSATFRGNPEAAAEFERQMKSAGHYLQPQAGMTVTRPDNGVVVFYRASAKLRGRPANKSADKPSTAAKK